MVAKPRQHAFVRLGLRQAGELSGLLVHPAVRADHRELGQPVVAADLEVGRIVPGCHLERTGAELRLDPLVRDDRHAPFHERDDRLPADEVAVAFVVRVDCDGHVGQHRRRADRRDRDRPGAVCERVAGERERVVDLLVLQLQVGQRGQVVRAPVDDPIRAVDPATVPEVDEERRHGLHVRLVHREALPPVVHRGAHTPELVHDLAPVLPEPLPYAGLEPLAPELLPRGSFLGQLLLDRGLGRDSRVVVAALEEHVVALHSLQAREGVAERELEGMPEMELAGHVRRRERIDPAGAARVGLGVVQALLFPGPLPALLDSCRAVEGLHAPILRTAVVRPPGFTWIQVCAILDPG